MTATFATAAAWSALALLATVIVSRLRLASSLGEIVIGIATEAC